MPEELHDHDHVYVEVEPKKGPHNVVSNIILGNPGPFGLLCFGMTTDMLMFITTGWAKGTFLPTVIAYATFYGGMGQFVAGAFELIKGNTFAGTAFSSYGAFWLGWAALESAEAGVSLPGKALWCGLWALLTAGFFVVTLEKNRGLQTIFSSLVLTFMLLAGGNYNARCHQAAGYVGFFCGTSALYTAMAMLYKDELGIELPGIAPTHFFHPAPRYSTGVGMPKGPGLVAGQTLVE